MRDFLEIKDISKAFPGVKALLNVTMSIRQGEVHALCGENGAGKSTLMNVLAGNIKQDSGELVLNGEELKMHSQRDAQNYGISIVYQERSLIDELSVAENIFANRQPKNKAGLINRAELNERAAAILKELDMEHISPKSLVGSLPPAKQQMVEIAKALSQKPKLLILDEPTATITQLEVNSLFKKIKRLKQEGVTVIYISHRLVEIFEIADRVSVLKDGKFQGTHEAKDIVVEDIIKLMVGRDVKKEHAASCATDETVLKLKDYYGDRFENISFELKKGEILAFAGLAGAGRTELARAIVGADRIIKGEIWINGNKASISSPQDAMKYGVCYLPEDRNEQGLFLEMSIQQNIVSGSLRKYAKTIFINEKRMFEDSEESRKNLQIATPSVKRAVNNLSGGNKQKVVFAKWLLLNSDILIVDEPTRGIDVGAKSEIYKILRNLAKQGKSIIVISSDLPEVLEISDRILVMWNGKITGEVSNQEVNAASEEVIMRYASGIN